MTDCQTGSGSAGPMMVGRHDRRFGPFSPARGFFLTGHANSSPTDEVCPFRRAKTGAINAFKSSFFNGHSTAEFTEDRMTESAVWLHFSRASKACKGDKNSPALCLHCSASVPRSDSSTKYMWEHLTKPMSDGGHGLKREVLERLPAPANTLNTFFPSTGSLSVASQLRMKSVNKEDLERACLLWVTESNLPLSLFEHPAAVDLVRLIAPDVTLPSYKVLKLRLQHNSDNIKESTL